MPIDVDDLIGLNLTSQHDMPVVGSQADAVALLGGVAKPESPRLVAAGMRHSQGGHTALIDGRMLITEAMREVTYHPAAQTFTAEAGATWAQIHHTLVLHGRAPLVHQSSGHFTVGGSLAVNCHGRDPSQGPLVNTVVSVEVLCGDGEVRTAAPGNPHQDLFCAVIGGYGCCGLILRATFRTAANAGLEEIWGFENDASRYVNVLAALPSRLGTGGKSTLHYGWLCCLAGKDFLNEVVYADYVETTNGTYSPVLKDEAWGTSEVLRASWSAAAQDPKFHAALWREIKGFKTHPAHSSMNHRINWMRAAVSFTASRGHPDAVSDRVEMLQEYFVPLARLMDMLTAMRAHLAPGNGAGIRLLTCTVRVVQPEDSLCNTALCYAKSTMVCLALEASVPLVGKDASRAPTEAASRVFTGLTDVVLSMGGRHYLPYYRFGDVGGHGSAQHAEARSASVARLDLAYPGGRARLKKAVTKYDPERKFNNEFLKYFDI